VSEATKAQRFGLRSFEKGSAGAPRHRANLGSEKVIEV